MVMMRPSILCDIIKSNLALVLSLPCLGTQGIDHGSTNKAVGRGGAFIIGFHNNGAIWIDTYE